MALVRPLPPAARDPRPGVIALQKLSPVDLNRLYRRLVVRPTPARAAAPATADRFRTSRRAARAQPAEPAKRSRSSFESKSGRGEAQRHQERLSLRCSGAGPSRSSAARILEPDSAENGPLHPHHHPRRVKDALRWTGRAQRRRRRHSPSAAGARPLRRRHGRPTSSAPSSTTPPEARTSAVTDLPRHERLPQASGILGRPMERRRSRRRHRHRSAASLRTSAR